MILFIVVIIKMKFMAKNVDICHSIKHLFIYLILIHQLFITSDADDKTAKSLMNRKNDKYYRYFNKEFSAYNSQLSHLSNIRANQKLNVSLFVAIPISKPTIEPEFQNEFTDLQSMGYEYQNSYHTLMNEDQNRDQFVIKDNINKDHEVVNEVQNRNQSVITVDYNKNQTMVTEDQSKDQTVVTEDQSKDQTVVTEDQSKDQTVVTENQNTDQTVITENSNEDQIQNQTEIYEVEDSDQTEEYEENNREDNNSPVVDKTKKKKGCQPCRCDPRLKAEELINEYILSDDDDEEVNIDDNDELIQIQKPYKYIPIETIELAHQRPQRVTSTPAPPTQSGAVQNLIKSLTTYLSTHKASDYMEIGISMAVTALLATLGITYRPISGYFSLLRRMGSNNDKNYGYYGNRYHNSRQYSPQTTEELFSITYDWIQSLELFKS